MKYLYHGAPVWLVGWGLLWSIVSRCRLPLLYFYGSVSRPRVSNEILFSAYVLAYLQFIKPYRKLFQIHLRHELRIFIYSG